MFHHTFIILDDDKEDIEILKKVFSLYHNLRIDYFTDGRNLIKWLNDCQDHLLPTVIFTDLNMPYLDGYQFVSMLRSNPRFINITIKILSTSSEQSEMDRCKGLGASDYIVKPSDYTGYKLLAKRIADAA